MEYLHCGNCQNSFQKPSNVNPESLPPCPSCGSSLQLKTSSSPSLPNVAQKTTKFLRPLPRQEYPVKGTLGQGGFGQVLEVQDPFLRRMVAMKILHKTKVSNMKASKRFLQEMIICGRLSHPNIIPLYEGGYLEDGTPYFTMRKLESRTLKDVVQEQPRLPLSRLLQIFLKICEAIDYAHSQKIIHRDLKPSNIAVGKHGEVIVMDWGLAKYIGGDSLMDSSDENPFDFAKDLTISSGILGTPNYMAPEQAKGPSYPVTERNDIYSLGAILYYILTGAPPFEGPAQKVLTDLLLHDPIPPRKRKPEWNIPIPLEKITLKAMAKEPSQRYESVAALVQDIHGYLDDKTISVYTPPLIERTGKWMKKHLLLVLSIFSLSFLTLGFFYLYSQSQVEAQKKLASMAQEKNRLFQENLKNQEKLLESRNRELTEKKKRLKMFEEYQRALVPYLEAKDALDQGIQFARVQEIVIPKLKRAIRIYPQFIEPRWELIKLSFFMDRPWEAQKYLHQMLQFVVKTSKSKKAPKLLGIVTLMTFVQKGKTNEFLAKFSELIRELEASLPPFFPKPYWHLFKSIAFFYMGSHQKALEEIDLALKDFGAISWEFLAQKAIYLCYQKRIKEAEMLLDDLVEKYPHLLFVYLARCQVFRYLRRYKALEKEALIALKLDPTCYSAWSYLGYASMKLALKLTPGSDNYLAYFLRAYHAYYQTNLLEPGYDMAPSKIKTLESSIRFALNRSSQPSLDMKDMIPLIMKRAQDSSSVELKGAAAFLVALFLREEKDPSLSYWGYVGWKLLQQWNSANPLSLWNFWKQKMITFLSQFPKMNKKGEWILDRGGIILRKSGKVAKGVYTLPDKGGKGAILIQGDNLIIDFQGATLLGSSQGTPPNEYSGIGLFIQGKNIQIRNLNIHKFKVAIYAFKAPGILIENCNLSDNWRMKLKSTPTREDLSDWLYPHKNDQNQWLRYGAAIYLERCDKAVVRNCEAKNGQNGLCLVRTNGAKVYHNKFHFLSGWGVALWRASENKICYNNLDWCIRGFSYGHYYRGQDSAAILVFEQCSRNVFAYNSATHSGDGFFLYAGNETTEKTGKGGSNDNLIYRNDFSHAATNGIEATFSTGNRFIENKVDQCLHGIWAGFSRNSLFYGNIISRTNIGIAIEHGSQNKIIANRLRQNAVGIKLWWKKESKFAKNIYGKHNNTRSEDYLIQNNLFLFHSQAAIQILGTSKVKILENTFRFAKIAVSADEGSREILVKRNNIPMGRLEGKMLKEENFPQSTSTPYPVLLPLYSESLPAFPGSRKPFLPKGSLRGWKFILIDQWGPYDFSYYKVWPNHQLFFQKGVIYILGPKGSFDIRDIQGRIQVRMERKTLPTKIEILPRFENSLEPFQFTVIIGKQKMPVRGILLKCKWKIKIYKDVGDPRKKPERWKEKPVYKKLTEDKIDFIWYGGGPALGLSDHYALQAETRLFVPKGYYILTTISDDGIRVKVDGKTVLENWTWHGPTKDQVKIFLEEGYHDIVLEYFELIGHAELHFTLKPAKK